MMIHVLIQLLGPVASALLAVAEWKGGFSGKEFLLALIVGVEAECKVGLAVRPEHHDVWWHITCTTGSIEAAAAVAKLLNVSIDQTTHALGIVVTQVFGLRNVWVAHQVFSFRSCSSKWSHGCDIGSGRLHE
ncbi:hypothetical protein OCU04_012330 [Sclerotinia nivalis]|uniref:MmgE/PrpD N-terminal domain-containing protein n=1 Tax=Sclerotinia nivalis TaxID=352851 RepID=A0A9X0ABH8_9HELO|nr:hypothetical protein OCU04_012330 [Sclerotinia nivalis]